MWLGMESVCCLYMSYGEAEGWCMVWTICGRKYVAFKWFWLHLNINYLITNVYNGKSGGFM